MEIIIQNCVFNCTKAEAPKKAIDAGVKQIYQLEFKETINGFELNDLGKEAVKKTTAMHEYNDGTFNIIRTGTDVLSRVMIFEPERTLIIKM